MKSPVALALVLAGLSGLLSFVADYPVHAWPLGAVALVPLLVALARAHRARDAALAATVFGVTYHAPLAAVLKLPVLMTLPLAVALTALWVGTGLGAWWSLRKGGPITGALAAGAAAALMEWASATLVPVWGTAQSFVRTWSASPAVMQVTALGGATALVFVVVAWQALAARVVVSGGSARRSAAVALVLLGAAVVGAGQHRASAPAPGARTLRVAAIGWRSGEAQALGRRGDPGPTLALYEPLLGQAAAAGARLVVSPEVGFTLGGERTAETLARLGALARRHRVWLVVGYFDRDHRDNHAALIGPDGARAGDYRKTHLIPLLERYRAGDGRLVTADLGGGAAAGAMICQDDNFTDLARGYGRRGVALVAVPTFDWAEVAPYHYESSRFRAVEAGYGVVRAAVDGTSAITDARGHVLAERNHLAAGRGVVIADLPLHAGGTLYATAGAFVPLLWIAVLLVVAVRSARRRQ